jgi:hypothetical protein
MNKSFVSTAAGQHFLCSAAMQKQGRADEHFMELLRAGDITSSELQKLIERRPSLWGRYQGFIAKLQQKEQHHGN